MCPQGLTSSPHENSYFFLRFLCTWSQCVQSNTMKCNSSCYFTSRHPRLMNVLLGLHKAGEFFLPGTSFVCVSFWRCVSDNGHEINHYTMCRFQHHEFYSFPVNRNHIFLEYCPCDILPWPSPQTKFGHSACHP